MGRVSSKSFVEDTMVSAFRSEPVFSQTIVNAFCFSLPEQGQQAQA